MLNVLDQSSSRNRHESFHGVFVTFLLSGLRLFSILKLLVELSLAIDHLLALLSHYSTTYGVWIHWHLFTIFTREITFVTSCLFASRQASYEKGSILKEKNSLPRGAKSLLLEQTPFRRGRQCPRTIYKVSCLIYHRIFIKFAFHFICIHCNRCFLFQDVNAVQKINSRNKQISNNKQINSY